MFWVLIQDPENPQVWAGSEFIDLNVALKVAEAAYKVGQIASGSKMVQCVQVIQQGVVKAKWGPEDSGEAFNTERSEDRS